MILIGPRRRVSPTGMRISERIDAARRDEPHTGGHHDEPAGIAYDFLGFRIVR